MSKQARLSDVPAAAAGRPPVGSCSGGLRFSRSSQPWLSQAEKIDICWSRRSRNNRTTTQLSQPQHITHISTTATMPPADRKRKIHKTNAKAVDSISFDFDSRQEYLTGFHKRKVQRAEHGRELAQRKEKEAVVQARKEVCITISPKIT